MNRKLVLLMTLTIFLIGMLAVALKVQRVKAVGTIYIRADGSVDPPTAPISSVNNVTYTFTGNVNDSIVVKRDNIVVDGAGYTLQGTGSGKGIDLSDRSNVAIKNMKIEAFDDGIFLYGSSNNTISGNNITNNTRGIWIYGSSNNIISGGNITNNKVGVWFHLSSNNTISGNNITNNEWFGVWLYKSSNNKFYHNNFIYNTYQVYVYQSSNNWDDGYPSGGNYWSDYKDRYSDAEELDDSGIWDTPYEIDESNQDNYPLMSPRGLEEVPEEPPPPPVEEVPFWMQWWFWTIVIVAITLLAGAVYFLKKRKLATPTALNPKIQGLDVLVLIREKESCLSHGSNV